MGTSKRKNISQTNGSDQQKEMDVNLGDKTQQKANKRQKQVKNDSEGGQQALKEEHHPPNLSEFERKRMELIQRNLAILKGLGLLDTAAGFAQAVASGRKQKVAAKAEGKNKGAKEKPTDSQPVRSSRRLKQNQEQQEEIEGNQELGQFIVDGKCPRCGRIITRNHKQHYEECDGQPSVKQERPYQPKATLEERLKQLELSGLVEFTSEHAQFMVIGSTGKHYTVTLSDEKRRCQCIDHRIRRHDCKHIKLLLKNLEVEDNASNWREGVSAMVNKSA